MYSWMSQYDVQFERLSTTPTLGSSVELNNLSVSSLASSNAACNIWRLVVGETTNWPGSRLNTETTFCWSEPAAAAPSCKTAARPPPLQGVNAEPQGILARLVLGLSDRTEGQKRSKVKNPKLICILVKREIEGSKINAYYYYCVTKY
uniref:Uncharacterized protein n=1 Tax=Romanomermis culicivorax TaxID=13658 RepID=A0A915I0J6_ROMCU